MNSFDRSTNDVVRFTGAWVLAPEKTTVRFRTKSMWILPVKGTAGALRGNTDAGSDGAVNGTLGIDAASFDTQNKKRDVHLRSEDFFEVAKSPTIFCAKEVRLAASRRMAVPARSPFAVAASR